MLVKKFKIIVTTVYQARNSSSCIEVMLCDTKLIIISLYALKFLPQKYELIPKTEIFNTLLTTKMGANFKLQLSLNTSVKVKMNFKIYYLSY